MATIIDSLLVTLGMDSSAFKAGVKEVEKAQTDLTQQVETDGKKRQEVDKKTGDEQSKRAKDFQDSSRKSAEAVRQVRNQALGLLALFTGGIGLARFTSDTITTAAGVGRLSANIGESIPHIIGWQRAFENVGGTAEEATASLTRASNAIGAFKSGRASPEIQGFLQMGGSISGGELNSPAAFLMAQSELIQRVIKERGEQVAMFQAQSFLGIGANEFNLLKQGPQAVGRQVESLGAGSGINAGTAAAAAALQVKINALKHTFEDTGRAILLSLIPVFEKLLVYFNRFAKWISSNRENIAKFVDDSVELMIKFGKEADAIAQKLGGWEKILLAIAAIKLASLVTQLTSILGLVVGIAAAASAFEESSRAGAEKAAVTPGGVIEGTETTSFFKQKLIELEAMLGNERAQELLKSMAKMGNKRAAQAINVAPGFNGAQQSAPAQRSSTTNSGARSETNIDTININTQATDANGIAREIKPAIQKNNFVPQANSGVN